MSPAAIPAIPFSRRVLRLRERAGNPEPVNREMGTCHRAIPLRVRFSGLSGALCARLAHVSGAPGANQAQNHVPLLNFCIGLI